MIDTQQVAERSSGPFVLHIELRDRGWPLADLTAVFSTFNDLYVLLDLLWSVRLMPEDIVKAGIEGAEDDEEIPKLRRLYSRLYPIHPLVVRGIELHSPGWLEVLGSWH